MHRGCGQEIRPYVICGFGEPKKGASTGALFLLGIFPGVRFRKRARTPFRQPQVASMTPTRPANACESTSIHRSATLTLPASAILGRFVVTF